MFLYYLLYAFVDFHKTSVADAFSDEDKLFGFCVSSQGLSMTKCAEKKFQQMLGT